MITYLEIYLNSYECSLNFVYFFLPFCFLLKTIHLRFLCACAFYDHLKKSITTSNQSSGCMPNECITTEKNAVNEFDVILEMNLKKKFIFFFLRLFCITFIYLL